MSNVVLYIAQSLDGFIAKPDNNIDWLTSVPPSVKGDYGYTELINSIDTIIMGRKTYEVILAMQEDWMYKGKTSYIVSSNQHLKIKAPDTHLYNGDLKLLVDTIKQKSGKDIWLIGGGELITGFINADLIDKMIITIVPKIIGEGIPLFAPIPKESVWQLVNVESFETGLVNLTYEK